MNMKCTRFLFLAIGILFLLTNAVAQQIAPAPKTEINSATVPLIVEYNRPFVDLEFTKPDGSARKARFWVDTGGGGFLMAEPLARDLNLTLGESFKEGGQTFASIKPPPSRIGAMPLNLENARAFVLVGAKTVSPGVEAEGMLPGHILKQYHVIFDYPGKQFTLAKPGSLKPRGTRMVSPVNEKSGFPRIEAQIGGETFGFLLDTGASFTMISQELMNRWITEHSDWQHTTGAFAAANMIGNPMEAKALMMRIPQVNLADAKLEGVAAVSRPKGTFENFMSQMMAAPIVGAIGGNVLSLFRIEIDYANGATYFEKRAALNSDDVTLVGINLSPNADGSYKILSVSERHDKEVIEAIKAGDKLIKIGNLEVTNAPLAKVIEALRGKPDEKRVLVLERDGKQFSVTVPVLRIL